MAQRRSDTYSQASRPRHAAQQPARRPSGRQAEYGRRSAAPEPGGSHVGVIVGVLVALVAIALVVVFLVLPRCSKKEEPVVTPNTQQQISEPAANTQAQAVTPASPAAPDLSSWELTLVNAKHPLPSDWNVNVVEVRDSKYIDARIADQLEQMVADCAAAGYDDVFINEAYRSHERQQEIWDEFYQQYLSQGYSEEEALELTGASVAVPGTSEHELGLAADICSINFDEEYNAPIQTWLKENGWKYGFVQRYPAGKESVTGIKNENWHFRYVGVDAAKAMHDSGQVLEEYLGLA